MIAREPRLQEANTVGSRVLALPDRGSTAKRQEDIVKALRLVPVQCKTLTWIKERQLHKIAVLVDARRKLSMRVR